MSVVVFGSFIMDCIATTPKAPEAGETVVGLTYNTYFGGKGANQAFASKRMGSETYMIGAVGNDAFGKDFIKLLTEEGFDPNDVVISNKNATGVSLVTVETNGQNRICMVPGANMDYELENIEKALEKIKNANVIVTQCEMQYSIVKKLAQLCQIYNKKFILNPAPARKISSDILKNTYVITPNETELGVIIERELVTIDDYISGAKELLKKGVKNVVVTLGSKGSLLVTENKEILIPAFKVKAIDTVGAGDSFTGSLAALIDQGYEIEEALKISTAVSALEVQKKGAIPAIPYLKDVMKFLKEQKN